LEFYLIANYFFRLNWQKINQNVLLKFSQFYWQGSNNCFFDANFIGEVSTTRIPFRILLRRKSEPFFCCQGYWQVKHNCFLVANFIGNLFTLVAALPIKLLPFLIL
jgi:hypothetical protein